MAQRFTQKTTETLDYDIPLDEYFAERADTIASHTVTIAAGPSIVTSTQSLDPKLIRFWVLGAGATDGAEYAGTVRLTTTSVPPVIDDIDFVVRFKDT